MKYVNVYAVTRAFGGHEEGGWWYDHYTNLCTYPVSNDTSHERAEAFREDKEVYWEKRRPYMDNLSHADIRAYLEDEKAEMETTDVPQYS